MAELATIARPYAEALFKASGADLSSAAAWLDELTAIASNAQLQQYAANPGVTSKQTFDVMVGVAKTKLPAAAENFLKDCLERTRKHHCDIIVINHQTTNYNKTKPIIFECTDYFLNLNTNRNSALKFLKSYMELSDEDLNYIKNAECDNRFCWSVFRKSYPSYYIHGNRIRLL